MAPKLRRAIVKLLARAGYSVRKVAPGAVLVTDRDVVRGRWFDVEKGLGAYVGEQHVAHLLAMYRVNCVIDVGANRGQYGRRLRRGGYDGHIVSFEPVRETFAKLQAEAANDPRWTVHPYALGAEEGTTSINVVPGTMSSVLTPTAFGAARYAQLRDPATEEIEIRRLDGILDDVLAPVPDPRPFLKLDTQGYDLEVFRGLGERARELVGLQSEVGVMQIYEGTAPMPEAIAVYEAAGFGITALHPVSRQSRTGRVVEFDCVMVRAELL